MTKLSAISQQNSGSENDEFSSNEDNVNVENSHENGTDSLNAAWADSIKKILKTNKPKGKKTIVLSKAKKLSDIRTVSAKSVGFEVETEHGEIKSETLEEDEVESSINESSHRKKRDLANYRVKPNVLAKDRERTLTKIATKGVVQLFNAVRMQQKDISQKLEEAGPLESKKEKFLKNVDKRIFLDVLMGQKSQIVDENVTETKVNNQEKTWSVLRDDFMMSAKLKDWDKELEEEQMETE